MAQSDTAIELGGGFLNVMGTMNGGNAQVGLRLNDRWTLVGEVNAAKGRDCRDCDQLFKDVSALAGVRANWRPRRQVTLFTQILVGGLHSEAEGYAWETTFANNRVVRGYEEGFTVNYLAVQPGVGATIMMTPRVGLRLQTDIQLAIPDQSEYEGYSLFPRTTVGGVARLGLATSRVWARDRPPIIVPVVSLTTGGGSARMKQPPSSA